jgi:hypothetical protein
VSLARLSLGAILLLAAVLRFWALGHGLPFVMARPDEVETLQHTVGFPQGDMNPRWFVYPNLFFWIVWLWEELCLGVRRLVADVPSYGTLLESDMPTLILQGRVLIALLGVATVALVYRLGRREGGTALGLVSALLLATCFLHVRDSHALKADVPLTIGVLVSLWTLARYRDEPTVARAVLAGTAIGITTALKYPGVILLFTAWHAAAGHGSGWRRMLPARSFVWIVVVATIVFLAACPYLLIDRELLVTTFSFSVRAVYWMRPHLAPREGAPVADQLAAFLATRTFAYHVHTSLRYGCGIAMALATPAALLLAFRRDTPSLPRLAASFVIVYWAVIGWSQVPLTRYWTPTTPLLALLVGRLVLAIAHAVRPGAVRHVVTAGLVMCLVAEPLAASIAHNRIAAREDTRVEATAWMAAHLPPGAVVARLGSAYFPIADPMLPPGVRAAPLELGETDLDRHGVTHVVTHEHPLHFSRPNPTQMHTLQPRLRLLAEFSPFAGPPTGGFEPDDAYYVPFHDFAGVVRPGPIVRVYAFTPPS